MKNGPIFRPFRTICGLLTMSLVGGTYCVKVVRPFSWRGPVSISGGYLEAILQFVGNASLYQNAKKDPAPYLRAARPSLVKQPRSSQQAQRVSRVRVAVVCA